MQWFVAHAPIRRKLRFAFLVMTSLVLVGPLTSLFAPRLLLPVSGAVVLLGIAMGEWFRRTIANPYVTTVLRMEALAAGDLESPIAFTDYTDCVGRMTKAMFAFRANAAAQIRLNEEADKHGAIVRGMTVNLRRLAEGDLTAEITEQYPAAYAELKANFNQTLGSLRELIGTVGEGSTAIRDEVAEIAQAAESLARRTESNAANLEETSAAISQIDTRLKHSSVAAAGTVERADAALAVVSRGRSVTESTVEAMARVSSSAEGIDNVIEGLDKIAFQTRVLAMNAAVEAGRAGEAGRGFAVVADLVSALAMRAEEEAKRAREQLTVTRDEIVSAATMVGQVDTALTGISESVSEVHRLVAGMAEDNRMQASAVNEISAAIGTMDASTQQAAAMFEEMSASTRNLRNETQLLSDQATRFRTANGAQVVRGARALPPSCPAPVSTVH